MMADQKQTPPIEPRDSWLWFVDEKLVARLFGESEPEVELEVEPELVQPQDMPEPAEVAEVVERPMPRPVLEPFAIVAPPPPAVAQPAPAPEIQIAESKDGSLWQQASSLFSARQFDDALARYRELLLDKPEDPVLHYNCAVCLSELGRYGEASQSYESALELAPGLSVARVGLAWCLLHLRQPQPALDIFDLQLRQSSDHLHALQGRAQALHLLSRLDEAKSAYEDLLSADPGDADILANLIAIAAEQRDSDTLRHYSEYLLKIRSRSRQAFAGLITAEQIDGRYELARKHATTFLELEPRSYEGWFNYGIASQMLHDLDGAEQAYKQASELNPKRVEPHMNRGALRFLAGDLLAAQGHFEEALRLEDGNPIALWNLGLLLEASDKFEEAESYFSRLASSESHGAGAAFHIGMCHFKRESWPMSIAAFERSLNLDPSSLESPIYLGLAYWRTGNKSAAARSFDRVLEKDPANVPALQCRTALAISAGDLASAPELEAQLADLGKTTPEFCFNLGMLQYGAKEYDAAAHSFRRAVAKRPAFGDALLNLGYALDALGQHEQAIAVWRDVMTVEPELPVDYFQTR